MELPYDAALFHSKPRAEQKERQASRFDDKNVSTLHAATRRGADVVGVFGSIASHAIRYPVSSLSSAAKTVLQPATLLSSPEAKARRREENERLARRTRLLQQLSHATSWPEYNAASEALDQIEGADSWKQNDDSDLYDVSALMHRLRRFHSACDSDDVEGMVRLIRCELTRDVGGICNPQLYQQTRTGTKYLVDDYVSTVREVLDRVVRACAEGDVRLDKVDVQAELEQTRRSYGRTALLLSGGGTLGMCHIGVIKALFEGDALPRIISGSSSGSIVAAVLGSTPDEDLLPRLHDFCHGDLAVFVGPHEKQGWSARAELYRSTGHVFDLGNLRRVMVDLLGKTTFLEAYNRTRRVLNIAVSTTMTHDSQKVLNYATAPNVVIWSAVVASCALPLGFEPERLLCKVDDHSQNLIPWDPETRYIDGSINGDLPASILSAEFDVNHSIVSQVNPHVAPFLSWTPDDNKPIPFAMNAAALVKEEATHAMELFVSMPSDTQPDVIYSSFHSVLRQRYHGDITLLPVESLTRYLTLMTNPTPKSMLHDTHQGERATWPRVNMIKTHMDIELLIDDAVRRVSEHVSFSQSVSDLRKLQFSRSRNTAHSSGGRLRTRRASRHKLSTNGSTVGRHDQLHVKLSPAARKKGMIIKIPPEETPPSSPSSRASISASSDEDEDYHQLIMLPRRNRKSMAADLTAAVAGLYVQTQPNSPSSERNAFVDPSKPDSPGPPPMSLVMTPVTPRSGSPEANYKAPPSAHRKRTTSRSPPSTPSRSAGRGRGNFSWASRSVSPRLRRSVERKD